MSVILTRFEKNIQSAFDLDDKDSRKLERLITDISLECALGKTEILEFLSYGAEKEIQELKEGYNWRLFKQRVLTRINGS